MTQTRYLFDRSYNTDYVRLIQRALNANTSTLTQFSPLKVDGLFMAKSIARLKVFQEHHRLEVTGTYSARTSEILNRYIEKHYLTPQQFQELCATNHFDPYLIRAIMRYEGITCGYTAQGKAIMRLCVERFRTQLRKHQGVKVFNELQQQYSALFNPPEAMSDEEHWLRAQQARIIHERAALSSISIGMGLVPGDAYLQVGARSSIELLTRAQGSERNQLLQMLHYYLNYDQPLVKALERYDYLSIAAILFPLHERKEVARELKSLYLDIKRTWH